MKNITFRTKEYSGYKYEPFTMSLNENDYEKAVDLINEYKSENDGEDITLDEIENLLKENEIQYNWVYAELIITL